MNELHNPVRQTHESQAEYRARLAKSRAEAKRQATNMEPSERAYGAPRPPITRQVKRARMAHLRAERDARRQS